MWVTVFTIYVLYLLSERDVQNKRYCPEYFNIVRISGKIRSSLLLVELYNSSVTDADICEICRVVCPLKLDWSRYGLGKYFRILVTVKISVSLSRWKSLWEKYEVDVHVQQHAVARCIVAQLFYGTRFCEVGDIDLLLKKCKSQAICSTQIKSILTFRHRASCI